MPFSPLSVTLLLSLFQYTLSKEGILSRGRGRRYEVSIYRYNIGSEALFKADDSVAAAALG